MTTYSHETALDVSLTTNYAAIPPALGTYSVAFQMGATAIGDGMLVGMNALLDPALTRPQATKIMVVMTDGIHNTGLSPESAAYTCKHNKVIVYTVTFSAEANQGSMQSVANVTGGQHIHALNAAQLVTAFQDIARAIPSILIQ
jgi:Mg-chelatase subunit ChlD